MRANAGSAYGRDHGFSSVSSLAEFRRTQPLTSYAHYEPYLARVAAGEAAAMFGDGRPPMMFGCSSGTTGQGKQIPITAAALRAFTGAVALQGAFLPVYRPRTLRLQLSTFCAPLWRRTEAGTPVGSVLARYLLSRTSRVQTTLPDAALAVDTAAAERHVGLLLALRDEQTERVSGSFVPHLFGLLQYLERHWRRLVADLRRGRLGDEVPVSAEVRAALDAQLRPEPARAAQLEAEFSKGRYTVRCGADVGIYRPYIVFTCH